MAPTRQHVGILLSQIGPVNNIVLLPPATLHVFPILLESARAWASLPEGNHSMTGVRQAWKLACAIAAFMVLPCIPTDSKAGEGRTYRVQGQVVAVNLVQTPHMIVIKTPLSKHDDMTVGAKVTAQTKIVQKGRRISLQTINVGAAVWLTYIKKKDGVFARVIQVQ